MSAPGFRFAIDRGGTFTDVYADCPDGSHRTLKLLSEDPRNYADAPREGIRRILSEVTGVAIPRDRPVPFDQIDSIRMGTTVATNALLERKGSRLALLVTRGFKDLLQIGNQSRPQIFDLRVEKPDNLYETVIEIDERLVLLRDGEDLPDHLTKGGGYTVPVVTGVTGERLLVVRAPDAAAVRAALQRVYTSGVRAVAVVLMHSYTYAEHEQAVAAVAREVGFTHVSLSSAVMPMVKIVPRGFTACADAYLTPHIARYIASFRAGFEQGLAAAPGGGAPCRTQLSFMQSDGGLAPVELFSGHRAILSGPAGGVVGYARTAWDPVTRQPIVAFDMGGTSTDVSRFAGHFDHVFEATVAGIAIQAPQLDISTVAAGGGSRLLFRSGLFVVGPESVGAHPGPVCYRKGGALAVTDANLHLGRIVPEAFPHIFGPTEDQPLDGEATRAAFAALAGEVNAFYAAAGGSGSSSQQQQSVDEIAFGFLRVANEAMCRPIRALTQMRGFDITTHCLACFGGAGPQHACAIARALGMRRIFVSRFSGVLSAYGIALADVVNEAQAPVSEVLLAHEPAEAAVRAAAGAADANAMSPTALAFACAAPARVDAAAVNTLSDRLVRLAGEVAARLCGPQQRFDPSRVALELYVNLRYRGTDTAIMVPCSAAASASAAAAAGAEEEEEEEGDNAAEDASQHQIPLAAVLGSSANSISDTGAAADETAATAASAVNSTSTAASAVALARVRAGVAAAVLRFVRTYRREFGFVMQRRDVLVDDVRVRGIARSAGLQRPSLPRTDAPLPVPAYVKRVYFEGGWVERTPVFALAELTHGHSVPGPAMLIDKTSTIVVEPGFTAAVTAGGDIQIELDAAPLPAEETARVAPVAATTAAATAAVEDDEAAADPAADADAASLPPPDPIKLSIFAHRFMGIAEQMGRVLQRTSVSVNMRERLDYSCALFGPDGALVANAPHIPVHLGAMQEAVKYQLQHWGANLADGDVLVSNHPQLAGGSHLPDITVITPVFASQKGRICFFVASRGHHADIGGIAPGSMPPTSTTLREEGAAIVAFKLVSRGAFDEAGVTALLTAPAGWGIPGCVGSRNLRDCLSDLRAQVAANHRGIALVRALVAESAGGLRVVHAYMRHVRANAEVAVREMLARFSAARGLPPVGTVRAVDWMDDGTPIALAVTVDRGARTALFDFTGTGPEVRGNTNAPRAVTYSAVIYALRCLVGRDVPLNQGCLAPVTVRIPRGSILHPSAAAAVVGGNVLTSQRVVDVVLRAFGAAAASQGCMNNLTMGDASFGFYETIAGGAGAGPTWAGRSGVQCHMTNTRATDPEILERRYPVVLRAATLRVGSGGAGARAGGEGVLRELQFRRALSVSVLSERRAFRPYGLAGGGPGARGVNTLLRRCTAAEEEGVGEEAGDGTGAAVSMRPVNLGGKSTVQVAPGDVLRIETPGGGGHGAPAGTSDTMAAAVVAVQEAEQAEEYARAYTAATGGCLPAPLEGAPGAAAAASLAASPAHVDVVGDGRSRHADSAFAFAGSVGRYKETQETV